MPSYHAIPLHRSAKKVAGLPQSSLFQHTAMHQQDAISDTQPLETPASPVFSQLHQLPLQASVDETPARPSYQIVAPKPSDDGYQEIAAMTSDTRQPVGRVKIKGSPVQQKMEIASLWVDPEHRQQGVSKSLLAAATDAGKQQGYRTAQLGVDPEAPSMGTQTLAGIYARQGFKHVGHLAQGRPIMERQL